jgi:hypothetical protein
LSERLPAGLEVAAIVRRVQGEGGFASVLRRGDADRGTISLLVAERGRAAGLLERQMAVDFTYRWARIPGGSDLQGTGWREFIDKKSRIDPDCWVVELDVADAERFIAETTSAP